MNSRRSGFSLIEILIVVAILAVLTGVGSSYYNDYIEDARLATARSNLASVKEAISRYFKDHMAYPTNLENLQGPYLMQNPIALLLNPVSADPNARIEILAYKGAGSAYNSDKTDPNWGWDTYNTSNTHEFTNVRIWFRGMYIK